MMSCSTTTTMVIKIATSMIDLHHFDRPRALGLLEQRLAFLDHTLGLSRQGSASAALSLPAEQSLTRNLDALPVALAGAVVPFFLATMVRTVLRPRLVSSAMPRSE